MGMLGELLFYRCGCLRSLRVAIAQSVKKGQAVVTAVRCLNFQVQTSPLHSGRPKTLAPYCPALQETL